MMRLAPAFAAAVLLSGALHRPGASAAGEGLNRQSAERFVRDLQRALDHRDKRAVASLTAYPARVLAGGYTIPILNASELIRLFDVVFTPELSCAITGAGTRAGSPASKAFLQMADDGVSIGSGLIWASANGGSLKIARVIVPPSTSGATIPHRVRRIEFFDRKGLFREAFSGRLTRDDTDSYVLAAQKGQVLDVTIQGFRGSHARLRVLDQRSGKPPMVTVANSPRIWHATLPATGDYRIEVVRQAPYCDPPLTYSMIVRLINP